MAFALSRSAMRAMYARKLGASASVATRFFATPVRNLRECRHVRNGGVRIGERKKATAQAAARAAL